MAASALGRGNAIEDHAGNGDGHATQLLGTDEVAQEGPAAQQHQDGLAVPQHLLSACVSAPMSTCLGCSSAMPLQRSSGQAGLRAPDRTRRRSGPGT
jgi:hypothetical protein